MAQEQVRNIKGLVLDFDNTIVLDLVSRKGSEELKDQAWLKVFEDVGRCELVDILSISQKNVSEGKGDRYSVIHDVLKYYNFPEILFDREIKRRAHIFDDIVQEGLIKVGVSTENRKVLDELSRSIHLYVNTGTPLENVIESMGNLELMKYFRGIYGRPASKAENLIKIIGEEKLKPGEVLFVGDSNADWRAAKEVKCQFLGMQTARNKEWNENKMPFPIIYSLADIKLRQGVKIAL